MHTSTWRPYKLLSTILSCCNEISAKCTSLLHNFFTLIFGVSLNSALCRFIILFSIKRCGILSFLTHYPVHISIDILIQHDIFPHWDLMCFQSVPLIFLRSVYSVVVSLCVVRGRFSNMKNTSYISILNIFKFWALPLHLLKTVTHSSRSHKVLF